MAYQHELHAINDTERLEVAIRAAGHHARRLSCSFVIGDADQDDFEQIILLAILTRSGSHDERRGMWSTFVSLLARNGAADLARSYRSRPETLALGAFEDGLEDQGATDLDLRIDIGRAVDTLPPGHRQLVELIARTGSLADAQRASTLSLASFYRCIHDLRMRLLIAGLFPPREKERASIRT